MVRIAIALGFSLFLVTACKPKVAELVRDFVATEPHFQSSNEIVVSHLRKRRTFALNGAECNDNKCEVDDHGTTLEALLGAEGFTFRETHRGIHLGTSSIQHFEGELFGYGGWVENSAFAVSSGTLIAEGGRIQEQLVHSYSVGHRPSTNPVSGGASWNGVMVGAVIAQDATLGDFVRGDATVTVDFAASDVDVDFQGIRGRDNGLNYADMNWRNIPLANGTFEAGKPARHYQDPSNPERTDLTVVDYIIGHFYGGDHGEVGGVFTRDSIQGAFGAKR